QGYARRAALRQPVGVAARNDLDRGRVFCRDQFFELLPDRRVVRVRSYFDSEVAILNVYRPARAEVGEVIPLRQPAEVGRPDPATGAHRAELSGVSGVCMIAPNGRWVAGLHTERGVEVWDAERISPKVWAIAAGLITFGGVLVLGRHAGGRVASGIPQGAGR